MTDGWVVVVTGVGGGESAGGGLSVAIARRFGHGGAQVVLAGLDAEAGQRAADALRGEGLRADFEPLDVRDPGQSRALVARVAGERGGIDVWVQVSNAGAADSGPAETLAREAWDDHLAAMLSGAFYCAQAAGAHMLARGRGVIVNVASVNAYQAIEGRAAESAAQAGLVMLTQALGIEWAARGVRVVGVAPGTLRSDMDATGGAHGTPAAVYEHRTPMRRLGTAEEVAEAVFFLASDEAAFVVGETMRVDGGWTAYQMF